MTYRPEIDGLRAIAVLAVILFHAGFETFSGGFIGVDIFFVISGYLITSIILEQRQAGTFSFVNFYERRARRLLPALFFVVAVCIPFAWTWLLPTDMIGFARSLIAVATFSSNFLFWSESGYFDVVAELKPLLHTWSLAVEEQYYLLFPPFLILLWRLGTRKVVATLAVLAALSFLLGHYGPLSEPLSAFFLLPTRGWELLIGALVALRQFNKQPLPQSQSLSLLGLLMVCCPVVWFDAFVAFPSLYMLLPTTGVVLVILCTSANTLVYRLLSARILVGIGLISYSAYLWHQVLFAFARHYLLFDLTQSDRLILIACTLLFASATWFFIETPFRKGRRFSRRFVFSAAVLGAAVFIGTGVWIEAKRGVPERFSDNYQTAEFLQFFENSRPRWAYFEREGLLKKFRTECNFQDTAKHRLGQVTVIPVESIATTCWSRDRRFAKSVMIWGDSYAQMLNPGLTEHLPREWQVLQVASSGCSPGIQTSKVTDHYCKYSNWFAIQSIVNAQPDAVVLAQRSKHSVDHLQRLAAFLHDKGVPRVIFVGPAPQWRLELPKIIARRFWNETPAYTAIGLDPLPRKVDAQISEQLKNTESTQYASLIDYFCNDEGCLTHIGSDRMRGITSWDHGHLTPIASAAFARDVLVDKIVAQTR